MEISEGEPTEEWDEIHRFNSPQECRRFEGYLAACLRDGTLEEIEVGSRYAGTWLFQERWFKTVTNIVWRYVAPEPPFYGLFERVSRWEQEHPRSSTFGPYDPEPVQNPPGYEPMGRAVTGRADEDPEPTGQA